MSVITADFRCAALRRGIVVRSKKNVDTPAHITNAAVMELANTGFLVQPEELKGVSSKELTTILNVAREVMGADREWTAIYPGFPKQVEDLPTLTLLVEQILHYWSAGTLLPNYPDVVREGLPLEDMLRTARKVRTVDASQAAGELMLALVTSPVALSDDERELLKGTVKLQLPTLQEITAYTKASRNGENIAAFLKVVAETGRYTTDELVAAVAPSCDNVDQLLRLVLTIATVPSDSKWEANYKLAVDNLSDNNARAVQMKRISRGVRRTVAERVGELSTDFKADSLVARQDLWRRVMRAVHPYDFKLSEGSRRAADIIHSNGEYRTLNSLVEEAMEKSDVETVVELLSQHQPGNLLRRIVAILRLVKNKRQAVAFATAVEGAGARSPLTTLISAYNGVISANDEHARVTRVAGLTNTMVERKEVAKVDEKHIGLMADALKVAMKEVLKNAVAPTGAVAVSSSMNVPLVRRDASTSDRVLDRGQEMQVAGEGDTLRIFGHWVNNQDRSGYMDIGVVILDEDFQHLAVSTWNTWSGERSWSTYSGDKLVYPGDSAPEYIDVKLKKLREKYPSAKWAAMTVQSWSGFPMVDVDFIAGAMLRSDAYKGKTFDARTVATAFKPTTPSTQAVPFAVNLEMGAMVWIDSSNGSTASGVSSSNDESIGSIVYDEIARPRLTMGELAALWAEAHGVETVDEVVNRDEVLALLG